MKIFLSACTAFAITLALAVFSSLYINRVADSTVDILQSLPATVDESKNTPESILGCIKEAEISWSRRSRTLAFFINHREIDEIDTLFTTLRSSAESRDSGHYASTLASLIERLVKLSSSEGFSASSIF